MDGVAHGSPWSITASRSFLAAVSNPVEGLYYPPAVGSSHADTTGSTYDNTFSACNICPSGSLAVTFGVAGRVVPASTLGFPNPNFFSASDVSNLAEYEAQCGFDAFADLDAIPRELQPIFGPILIVVILVAIIIAVLPVPAAPAPPPVPPTGEPRLVSKGAYEAWTPGPPPSEHDISPSPIEPGGQSIGGVGVHVDPPVTTPPPTPPAPAETVPAYPPRCPRCGSPTTPADGRWCCQVDR